jgi:hypothetical protein
MLWNASSIPATDRQDGLAQILRKPAQASEFRKKPPIQMAINRWDEIA